MRRPVISLFLGLVLAAGALLLVFNLRAPAVQTASAATPTIAMTGILVASEDLAFGDQITADFIKTVQWPEEFVPENAILDKDEALAGPDGERIAIRSFVTGEPLLKSKISGYGERPILSRKITEEMRAFSIRINDVSGVAGFLLPGDNVDVLLTRELGQRNKNMITDIIIQNVGVLGIDQLANEETDNPVVARTATVEVTPEQAQKLALAQQLGTLSLTLRNYADVDSAEVSRVTVSDLGIDTPKRPVVRRDNGIFVRVRKGASNVKSERVPQ